MLVTTEKMFADALSSGTAVPAPDFWDQRSCRAFVKVAEEVKKPLILSFAELHTSMLGLEEAALLGKFYAEKASVPVALHLDHGVHMDILEDALQYGFTSVMIDASSASFAENVQITREAVRMARAYGASIEAEIGHVGVNEGDSARRAEDSLYTEVADAVRFVEETGVDSLAVSIGTSHGLYKGTPVINFERLQELRTLAPVPLVLHGGSSSGDENLRRCAREGIAKINLYTDFIVAARQTVDTDVPSDWPGVLSEADAAISGVLRHYYEVFGI